MRGGWVVIQSQGLHPWANVYLEKDGNNKKDKRTKKREIMCKKRGKKH